MNWWSRFWRNRKQNDKVKIQFLCFLIGVACLGYGIYHGIELYRKMSSSTEYVLADSGSRERQQEKIQRIRELDNVEAVSRQLEESVTFTGIEGEVTFSCIEISEEYLQTAYGISTSGSMQVFYLNSLAYEQLCREFHIEEAGTVKNQMEYSLGEQENGIAKIVVMADQLPNDTPCVFCRGDALKLWKNAGEIRVWVDQQDFEGTKVQELQQFGAEIVNQTIIEKNQLLEKMDLLRVKYNFILALFCFGFAWYLKRV